MTTKSMQISHSDKRIYNLEANYREKLGWYFTFTLLDRQETYAITRNYCELEPEFSLIKLHDVSPDDFYMGGHLSIERKGELLKYEDIIKRIKKLESNGNITIKE